MKKVLLSSIVIAAVIAGCGGNSSCCNSDQVKAPVAENAANIAPVAVITGLTNPTKIQAGQSISPLGSSSTDRDGSVTGYSWSVDGQTASTLANPTFTFNTAGTHEVCLTVTDNDQLNSANMECRTVTVEAQQAAQPVLPTAVITLTDSDAPLQIYTDHTFSCADSHDNDTLGNGNEIVRCDWDIQSFYEDGVTPYRDCSADNTVNHTVHICGSVGRIVTKLTVTDNDGQTATTTKEYTQFSR